MKELSYSSKNGINIYGIPNPTAHGFYISLFLRAGSMHESKEESGITHFIEHALIRNVNKLMGGTLYTTLDKYGMEFNASTYAEMVQFYVSGADKNIRHGMDIIVKLLCGIVLNEGEIAPERKRIKAEIRESGERTSLASFTSHIVNEGSSLSGSITGTLGSVSRIGVKRLEEYRRRVFVKENVFFYITGNYTEEDVAYLSSLVCGYDIPSGKHNDNVAPVPTAFGKRRPCINIKNADFTAVRFSFDIDTTVFGAAECDLLYDVLISGYGSKFFMDLSESKGLFYDVTGSLDRYKNIGSLSFTYEVRPDLLYDAVEATVGVLRSMKEKKLSEDECMKVGYTDNAYMLFDDYRELNFTFAYDNHVMDAKYAGLDDRIAAYSSVTPERLREVAEGVFSSCNMTFAMKGNVKKIDKERLGAILELL